MTKDQIARELVERVEYKVINDLANIDEIVIQEMQNKEVKEWVRQDPLVLFDIVTAIRSGQNKKLKLLEETTYEKNK